MAEFAYACRPCDGSDVTWFVALDAVAAMPRETQVVQVRVGDEWRCAILDRSTSHVIEGMLVRDAVAAPPEDCPGCYQDAADDESTESSAQLDAANTASTSSPSAGRSAPPKRTILGAAISIGGRNLVVVAARMDLVRDDVEADLVIAEVSTKLGGVPVVLMAQREDDGTPAYYGDGDLVDLLANVPIEKMPWKDYVIS